MAFIRGRALALALALALAPVPAAGLDNGVGRTPSTSRKPSPSISLDVWSEGLLVCAFAVMGWMAWIRFRCNIACDADPENCISERLVKSMADAMVDGGYKDAGYEYVSIDDVTSTRNPPFLVIFMGQF